MTDKIDKDIEELEQRIKSLKQQKLDLEELTEAQRLAIILHSKQCRANHVDQCGWDYEMKGKKHKWIGTHARYLTKAESILAACKTMNISYQNLLTVIGMI